MKIRSTIPRLNYGPWYRWEERHTIPDAGYPGVYMIAITKKRLQGKAPDFKDVSYIGMTNAQAGLKGRWRQFHQSITGRWGHSGGNAVYRDMGHYDDWAESLYVCAMPMVCNVTTPAAEDLIKMGWVAYLEYASFAAFKLHFPRKGKPTFNTR